MSNGQGWMSTNNDLLQQFLQGDQNAFNDLVRRHYPPIIRLFTRLVHDPLDVDDLCQETFLRVYHNAGRFRSESALSTWIYRIALNVAKSHWRRERWRRRFRGETEPDEVQGQPSNPYQDMIPELRKQIARLPDGQRTVVVLRALEGLPFKEVAAAAGISENSAKVQYFHAVARLKEWMNR